MIRKFKQYFENHLEEIGSNIDEYIEDNLLFLTDNNIKYTVSKHFMDKNGSLSDQKASNVTPIIRIDIDLNSLYDDSMKINGLSTIYNVKLISEVFDSIKQLQKRIVDYEFRICNRGDEIIIYLIEKNDVGSFEIGDIFKRLEGLYGRRDGRIGKFSLNSISLENDSILLKTNITYDIVKTLGPSKIVTRKIGDGPYQSRRVEKNQSRREAEVTKNLIEKWIRKAGIDPSIFNIEKTTGKNTWNKDLFIWKLTLK